MGIVINLAVGILVALTIIFAVLYWQQVTKDNSPNNDGRSAYHNTNGTSVSSDEPSAADPCDGDIYADALFSQFAKQAGMRCKTSLSKGGGEIGKGVGSTKSGCAAMCDLDPSCTTWQWNKGAQTCDLSNECGRYDMIQNSDYDLYLKLSAIDDNDLYTPENYNASQGWSLVDSFRRRLGRYLA